MRVRLTLRDQTSTGRQTGSFDLEDIPAALTLRDLIRTRVREEVAGFNAGPETKVFHGLVMPEGATPAIDGFQLPARRQVDWVKQADEAIDAFGRNGFFVIVDGTQATDLDAELALTADSDVRFVRLVPLVGG